MQIKEVLAIGNVSVGGRMPFPQDAIQEQMVAGTWHTPAEGDQVTTPRGRTQTWKKLTADDKGEFTGDQLGGGYAFAKVQQDGSARIAIMTASGDTTAYVNGEPHSGDPYGYGYLRIPIKLKKGENQLLFSCGRGRLNVALDQPTSAAMFNTGDMTLPDILENDPSELVGALPVLNCTDAEMKQMSIGAKVGDGKERKIAIPSLLPLSVRKLAFYMTPGKLLAGEQNLHLTLYKGDRVLDQQDVKINVRKPMDHYKNTFVSSIDGSVQYYAVAPSLNPSKENALVLTVHGASVEATNQANAYKSKDWCTIVAATNRRPYGFDWEDWGRLDAMEVWSIAKARFPHDPDRVILTGHSMGGHGTWQLGLTYPNEFAAIGPSAGWVSFWSYAGGWEPKDPTPVEAMLRRSMNQSDTLLMLNNALPEDIYILHGDKDDNVPVEQARFMKKALSDIGKTVEYHEEPGAGHWWGDQCVDWPAMFDMFSKANLSRNFTSRSSWSFTTINPAVNASCRGITIEQQLESMKPSKITVMKDGEVQKVQTTNVQMLSFAISSFALDKFEIDGQRPSGFSAFKERYFFVREGDRWDPWTPREKGSSSPTPLSEDVLKKVKHAGFGGPFKNAFQNRMVFVVGTRGTAEENAWAMNKARFDAEQWYYRGNGSVSIMRDTDPLPTDRNLVIYGNANTFSRWKELLVASPIQVNRKGVTLDGKNIAGVDLAALWLYPQAGRLLAVLSPTGMKGAKYLDRIPYFTSGVALPDWTISRAATLREGAKAVVGCGFFSNEWRYDPINSAWSAALGD